MSYIYKITNLVNQKLYIGKTSLTIEERFKEHLSDSQKESLEKRPLYDAIKKYGKNNFKVEFIEEVENDEIACDREKYWILFFNSYIGFKNSNGYNATLGGDGKRIYDYKEISKKYQELLSVKDTCDFFNCDPKVVRNACQENNVEIKLSSEKNNKKIIRIFSDGTKKIYISITEAAKDILNKDPETARKNISRALNRSKKHYAYDSFWIYDAG